MIHSIWPLYNLESRSLTKKDCVKTLIKEAICWELLCSVTKQTYYLLKIGIPLGKNLGFSARVEVFGPVRSSPIPASSGYTGPPFALRHFTNLYSTTLFQISSRLQRLKAVLEAQLRDRGATLRLGCTISDSILGGGGGTNFFLTKFL